VPSRLGVLSTLGTGLPPLSWAQMLPVCLTWMTSVLWTLVTSVPWTLVTSVPWTLVTSFSFVWQLLVFQSCLAATPW
jgi:hypothetical protein